jgi:predicted enzyme related to lactoylglutathione lyase
MDNTTNALNWFEIPVTDMARAKAFYENLFGIEMPTMNMMGMDMAFFPGENGNGKVSGALVKSEWSIPSMTGTLVYLNANPAMDGVLEKIAAAGCTIVMPKTPIGPDFGYMAVFADTEGNRVALHSMN